MTKLKFIKKDKCKFENGYIVKKDRIIGISHDVWLQMNKLETIMQQFDYLKSQPEYCAGPSLDGFERKSILDDGMPYVEVEETPIMDRRVDEAMKFMAEVDSCEKAAEINRRLKDYEKLIRWVQDDKFIEGGCISPIDLYILGNPLELDESDIIKAIKMMVTNPIKMEE